MNSEFFMDSQLTLSGIPVRIVTHEAIQFCYSTLVLELAAGPCSKVFYTAESMSQLQAFSADWITGMKLVQTGMMSSQ